MRVGAGRTAGVGGVGVATMGATGMQDEKDG